MLIREKEFIISAFVTKVACFNTNKSCSVNIFLSKVSYFKSLKRKNGFILKYMVNVNDLVIYSV